MEKWFSVKQLVATAIGAALFFVLGCFVSIPSGIDSTYICIQYGVLGLIAVVYGPIAGFFTGFIGHAAIDLFFGEIYWSWAFSSAVCGLVTGLGMNNNKIAEGKLSKYGIERFVLVSLLAHFISWVLVAPILDIILDSTEIKTAFVQGLVAGFANFVTTAVVGGLLIYAYATAVSQRVMFKDK